MPNYNHAKFLPASLAALARQSIPADEILVIDDASTDNSLEVLEGLARQYPLLKVYRNPVNLGVAGAVNRGLEAASGDFICLEGADDEVQPGFFEKTLRLLAEYPQAGLCTGLCRMTDMESHLSYNFGGHIATAPCYLPPRKIVELVRQDRFLVFGTAMLWRRDALLRAGKYHAPLRWHSDWFPMFALAFRHGICFVPEVLGEFRSNPSSLSNRGKKKLRVQLDVLRYALDLLDRPENQDIAPLFRQSGALAPFGKEMLWLVLSRRRYWKNINLTFLRLSLWWTCRIEAKKILPRSAARLYYKLAGVAAESPAP
jgi:glycosyltransferase involved in cell wall biosynthesis